MFLCFAWTATKGRQDPFRQAPFRQCAQPDVAIMSSEHGATASKTYNQGRHMDVTDRTPRHNKDTTSHKLSKWPDYWSTSDNLWSMKFSQLCLKKVGALYKLSVQKLICFPLLAFQEYRLKLISILLSQNFFWEYTGISCCLRWCFPSAWEDDFRRCLLKSFQTPLR